MIRFIFAVFFALLTVYNLAFAGESFDLRGSWIRTNAQEGEKPIQFILVADAYRSYSQERFVFENGRLSHTIDQSVKIQKSEGAELNGTVDFYDSRGCTFKNLKVIVDIQNEQTINVLMTVPRYKFVTYSRTPENRWERPTVIRTECRILEYVEVPVQLYRQ
jgi:hypothetical protein